MSLLDDHGTYFENDEEVVIPLLRQLDTPDGPPSRSRFFQDRASELIRVKWRRRAGRDGRCLALDQPRRRRRSPSAGRGLDAVLLHGDRLRRLGETTAVAWVADPRRLRWSCSPVDWLAGLAAWPAWFPTLGEWLLGIVLVGGRVRDPGPGRDRSLERLGRARALAPPRTEPPRGPHSGGDPTSRPRRSSVLPPRSRSWSR